MRFFAYIARGAGGFCAALALVLAPLWATDSTALDPAMFSVPARGDTARIPGERVSRYLLSSTDPAFSLPDTPFQRVTARQSRGGKMELLLQAGVAGANPPGAGNVDDTALLNLDDPAIRALAARLKGRADTIDAVERLVHAHITDKRPGIPIIPAREVALGRAGDCTEHAVLAVALLRSLGVPARAVVGMVYSESFEGARNVFVFHMWAEAHRNARWVLVDPTRPGEKQTNRYVAFSYHHLKTPTPLSYLRAVAAIKNLSVERKP
ncbi:MAG TPA: transglutaminase-like domain-containing protein [Spirochaetota bacterium]|nr:transglutaminase-like domain-containing protein [Spirochaetota bacterium]